MLPTKRCPVCGLPIRKAALFGFKVRWVHRPGDSTRHARALVALELAAWNTLAGERREIYRLTKGTP